MTNQVWLPVDGALLKKLREEAGVDITSLARIHSLSTAQVKQLEEGGDSSFYTPSIKLSTGRKLLMHFGADVAFSEKIVEEIHTHTPVPALEFAVNDVIDIKNRDMRSSRYSLRFQIFSALSIAIAFTVLIVFLLDAKTDTNISKPSKQLEVITPISANPLETKTPALNSDESLKVSAKTTTQNVNGCKWVGDAMSITGHHPTKPGDYVHVVANMDATICIKDTTGKLQILNLNKTQSQTFRGSPPFEIFSNTLDQFNIFYQGNLLKIPSSRIQNIILKEQKYD